MTRSSSSSRLIVPEGAVLSFLSRVRELVASKFQRQPRSGQVLLWLLRGAFGSIVISMAIIASRHFSEAYPDELRLGQLAFWSILGLGFLVVATDHLIRDKQITTISAVYVGLLLGLLLGKILSTALDPFLFDWDPAHISPIMNQRKALVTLLITVLCCYITISTLLQTKDEFRFIIPYVEFSKQIKGSKPLVLDTSVIIDGRIADICDTRFIDTKLIVPRFVLAGIAGRRRQFRQAQAEPRPARAGHAEADAEQQQDRTGDARGQPARAAGDPQGG